MEVDKSNVLELVVFFWNKLVGSVYKCYVGYIVLSSKVEG